MPYGEDYDRREVSFLESCGRSMDGTVWAIKMVSMADIGLAKAKPKARPKRNPGKSKTRRKKKRYG